MIEAYRYIMQLRHEPAVLVLSRQPLPTLDRKKYAPASGVSRGAYVLADAGGQKALDAIIIASGSEVSLAVEAHEKLVAEGIRSRVVSMPSWEIFEHQPQEYQDTVLPPQVTARVAVEQASTFGWERYIGRSGRMIGMKTFGASAPLKELQRKFGFEPDRVVAATKGIARQELRWQCIPDPGLPERVIRSHTACGPISRPFYCLIMECSALRFVIRAWRSSRRVEDLEAAAARGSGQGIPLLYPWANRLAEPRYRVLGQEVVLDKSSPLLHFDEHGLPMHGVPWALLRWVVSEARQDFMAAQLDWFSSDLLAVFPFRHRVELAVTLRPDGLTLETTVVAETPDRTGELWFSSLLRVCRAFARELASGTTGNAETSTRQAWNPDR